METRERSELQLMRISRSAHELTRLIHSWPKIPTIGAESECIANELLRGSLELQNSLQSLSVLQRASSRKSRGVEEEDAGGFTFQEQSSKINNIWLQETATKSMEVLKFTDSRTSFSSRLKKMKAPNLIAKLMGFEEFSSERKEGEEVKDLPEEKTLGVVNETDSDQDDKVPPIAILKSASLHPLHGEELISVTKMRSDCGKITLADLFLEEKSSGDGCLQLKYLQQSEVKRNVKYNTEQTQQMNTIAAESQQLQEKKVLAESGREEEEEDQVTQGKRSMQLKKVKAMAAPINTTYVRSKRSDKGIVKAKLSSKEIYPTKSPALDREKILNTTRRFSGGAKIGDKRSKDGNLRSSATETHPISKSTRSSITNLLPKPKDEESILTINKDCIRRNHKKITEVAIPRIKQAQRNSRKIKQSGNETTESMEIEVSPDQLLLDYSKEITARKNHEEVLHSHVRRSSRSPPFSHLLEENCNCSNGVAVMDSLYTIFENDLRCNGEAMSSTWDDGWNNLFGAQEADRIAAEVEEQIVSRAILEVVMDLVGLE